MRFWEEVFHEWLLGVKLDKDVPSTHLSECLWEHTATQLCPSAWRTLVRHINVLECDLPWAYTQDHRMLCRWHHLKRRQRRSSCRPEKSVRHLVGSPVEDEPDQVLPGGIQWQITWICCYIQGNSLGSKEDLCYSRDATYEKSQETQGFTRMTNIYPEIYIKSLGRC